MGGGGTGGGERVTYINFLPLITEGGGLLRWRGLI